jgi:hypothetical protein
MLGLSNDELVTRMNKQEEKMKSYDCCCCCIVTVIVVNVLCGFIGLIVVLSSNTKTKTQVLQASPTPTIPIATRRVNFEFETSHVVAGQGYCCERLRNGRLRCYATGENLLCYE